MSETEFIPYEEAKKIVSDVVEMEHPSEDGKRIFNVYNQKGYAICWFYAEDVENEIEAKEFSEVEEHILHFIPKWAVFE